MADENNETHFSGVNLNYYSSNSMWIKQSV